MEIARHARVGQGPAIGALIHGSETIEGHPKVLQGIDLNTSPGDRRQDVRGPDQRFDHDTRRMITDLVSRLTPDAITQLAFTSPQTGLPNRAAYLMIMAQQPEIAQKYTHCVMIDLDGLKIMNDNFGHEAGDRLLAMTGQETMNALAAQHDIDAMVFHISGDEFLALVVSPQDGRKLIDVLRKAHGQCEIELVLRSTGESVKFRGIRFSAGVGENQDAADRAMYADKNAREKSGERIGRDDPRGLMRWIQAGQ